MGDALVAVVLVLLVVIVVFLVRGIPKLFRDGKSSTVASGLGGVMTEVDRVVRPSAEHVLKGKQEIVRKEDEVGGE